MSVIQKGRTDAVPPAAEPRRGVFYGWWVVLACSVVATVSSGTGFYGPGLYIANISADFGWPRGSVAGALSLYWLASGLIGPSLGRYVDKHNPQYVMMLGSVLFASALIAQTFVNAIWQLYPIYLVMAMGFAMFGGVPVNTIVARWFTRKRGTAMSLAVSGFSVGGFVVVPLAGAVTAYFGWRAAMYTLAALTVAVVIPLTALVIVARPQHKGLLPDGDTAPHAGASAALPPPDWTAAEALRTTTFWAVVIAWLLGGLAMMGYVANQLSYLKEAGL
ncbi:MAG: MFS transporter, partial [Chloroflexi bacterium]|nr:MFS transporter [Chloroflexota bacterium]